jgi:hypothetical protein
LVALDLSQNRHGRDYPKFRLLRHRKAYISGSQFQDLLLSVTQRGASSISIGYHHGQERLVAFAAGPNALGGHFIDFGFALEKAKASAVRGGD